MNEWPQAGQLLTCTVKLILIHKHTLHSFFFLYFWCGNKSNLHYIALILLLWAQIHSQANGYSQSCTHNSKSCASSGDTSVHCFEPRVGDPLGELYSCYYFISIYVCDTHLNYEAKKTPETSINVTSSSPWLLISIWPCIVSRFIQCEDLSKHFLDQ